MVNETLKDARSHCSKIINFLLYLKNHHSKDVNSKFLLKQSSRLDTYTKHVCKRQLPVTVSYCVSLILVTITRHVFINIFQIEYTSAVKFVMDYEEKKYQLLCDTKISKSLIWGNFAYRR